MTYCGLLEEAEKLLEKNKISYGEYVEMVEPLNEEVRKEGEWIDHSNEGYVECPFCGSCTTCEDNIDELHFCFNCGNKLSRGIASNIETERRTNDSNT